MATTAINQPHWSETAKYRGWGTDEEIHFLRGLGGWSVRDQQEDDFNYRRLRLLEMYRDGMVKRHNWGPIDTYRVRMALNRMIAMERSRHV